MKVYFKLIALIAMLGCANVSCLSRSHNDNSSVEQNAGPSTSAPSGAAGEVVVEAIDRTLIEDGHFVYRLPSGKIYLETGFPLWYDLYKQYNIEVRNNNLTPAQVDAQNKQAVLDLKAEKIESIPGRLDAITKEQAHAVLEELLKNPVAGPAGRKKYDADGARGFCFGRAAFVHLELIARGVNKRALRKLFAVGPMNTGTINWQFHVTTIVPGKDGKWLTIDPVIGSIVDIDAWMKQISSYSTDKKLKFYITGAAKMGASSPKYSPVNFKNEFYNGYFIDLMAWFRKNRGINKPEDISFTE